MKTAAALAYNAFMEQKRPHFVDVLILIAGELVFALVGFPIYIFLVLPGQPDGVLPGLAPPISPDANLMLSLLAVAGVVVACIGLVALLSRMFGAEPFKVDAVDELLNNFTTPDLVVIYIAAGFAEEFLFRVTLMSLCGLVISALLFTAAHAAYWRKPLMLVYVFVAGLAMGLLFSYTGSLLLCAVAHTAYNLAISLLMKAGKLPLDKRA